MPCVLQDITYFLHKILEGTWGVNSIWYLSTSVYNAEDKSIALTRMKKTQTNYQFELCKRNSGQVNMQNYIPTNPLLLD